jgi:hypothetical protein
VHQRLWAVDQEGFVIDVLVQSRRGKTFDACQGQGHTPRVIITDKLRSYGAAKRQVIPGIEHRSHKGLNNRTSLFGRLKSSMFTFPVPGLQLSCGLLLLYAFARKALCDPLKRHAPIRTYSPGMAGTLRFS